MTIRRSGGRSCHGLLASFTYRRPVGGPASECAPLVSGWGQELAAWESSRPVAMLLVWSGSRWSRVTSEGGVGVGVELVDRPSNHLRDEGGTRSRPTIASGTQTRNARCQLVTPDLVAPVTALTTARMMTSDRAVPGGHGLGKLPVGTAPCGRKCTQGARAGLGE